MKIFSRHDFMELPAGTIFAQGVQWAMDGFNIKAETIYNSHGIAIDFFYKSFLNIEFDNSEQLFERYDEMLKKGISYPINESYAREGTFCSEDVFLVFEHDDLKTLVKEIQSILQ